MEYKNQSTENGQVMILLVLAFVILLGIASLAIDGGMVYSDRRTAQNAADAAALAGAGKAGHLLKNIYVDDWDCGSAFTTAINEAKESAIESALINQYAITSTAGITENLVTVTCSNGNITDSYLDVHVRIDDETPTTFSHLLFGGTLKNTVEATARVNPRMPFAHGNTIVSLTTSCGSHFDKGIVFGGNGDTTVTGGGIHSNSCLTLNGNSGEIDVSGGSVVYDTDDEYVNNGGMSITPAPTLSPGQINPDPIYQQCDTTALAANSGIPGVLLPGKYNNVITINNNESITLRSGLYCLKNGIKVNGGGYLASESTGSNLEGGVTLVIMGGNFDVAGNATVKLKAPAASCNATPDSFGLTCPAAIPGMLIYLPQGNTGRVSVAGTSESEYTGTIYAPDGFVDVGGTSSAISEVGAQIVANSVLIHGDTSLNLRYDSPFVYHWPAKLNMQR